MAELDSDDSGTVILSEIESYIDGMNQ